MSRQTFQSKPRNTLGILLTFGLFTLFFAPLVDAAPAPAAGSSILVNSSFGHFYSVKGFSLSAPLGWALDGKYEDGEGENLLSREIGATYSNPRLPTARVSVKTDTLHSEISLEAYARKWMKDYSGYGFDVLGAKTFSTNQAKGLVVDLVHRKLGQQVRQVIFLRKKTAVTLTCLDRLKTFDQSLDGCNQILKSFAWKEIPSGKKSF